MKTFKEQFETYFTIKMLIQYVIEVGKNRLEILLGKSVV